MYDVIDVRPTKLIDWFFWCNYIRSTEWNKWDGCKNRYVASYWNLYMFIKISSN